MSKKFKYALYINDVLIKNFYALADVDDYINNWNGYAGKIEIFKL